MGLQINTNVAALNAYRNLNGTQGSMQTSLERLSSGLRINRAADDAAGLAISEKLRSQVNGLNQAQANAQDGVSLIQTAEGALNETHAILQRMRTLAVQSASDSNTDADRKAIQKEVDALVTEIDDTTKRTQFNGMNLLDGSFKDKLLQIGANQAQTMDVGIKRMDASGLGVGGGTKVLDTTNVAGASDNSKISLSGSVSNGIYTVKADVADASALKAYDQSGKVVGVVDSVAKKITLDDGGTITTTGVWAATETVTVGQSNFSATNATGGAINSQAGNVAEGTYRVSGATILGQNNQVVGNLTGNKVTFDASVGGGSVTFAGTPADTETIVIQAGSAVDMTTQVNANDALKSIDAAIASVSDQRADLGALQNRLDHTIKNLGVSAENLAASESRIRDTDMAKEMTNFTRSQILQQAGVSMLAQANQSAQSVLKLLG